MKIFNYLKGNSQLAAVALLIGLFGCGGGSTTTDTTPANQAPTAVIAPAGDQTVTEGGSISFMGDTSSDADGDTPLTYAWTFSGAATSIQSSTAANPGAVTFSAAGSVSVSLVVTDSKGLASSATSLTVTVSAVANAAPSGSISHDNGDGTTGSSGDLTVVQGATIVFDSSVTDPEGDPITYAWDFQGGSPTTANTSGPISVSYANSGTFNVTLQASDNNGNTTAIPATPLVVTVTAATASLPAFKSLPVLTPTMVNGVATYTLNAEENIDVTVETPNGTWITPMMRYNGLQLPPVIAATRGDQISVTVNNNLTTSSEETTVHWHGFKIPGVEDGGPDFPIAPSNSRTYQFTMSQPAAPIWFHPHAHGTTATQVYKGLAGAFILTDSITSSLENNNQLPNGAFDVALLVQDREFASDPFNTGRRDLVYRSGNGMLGDQVLVNGVEMPELQVKTRQYRFRLFNGSNARSYDFALDSGATFKVIGTDGGLLNTPVVTDHVKLSAGERAEIVVDFASLLNQQVKLISRAFNDGGGMGGGGGMANGTAFDVMQFNVSTQETDPINLYTALPNNADINTRWLEADASVTRTFVMSQQGGGGGGGMQFLINNKTFDINRVDESVASGATEVWEISNTSGMAHPFHAHAIQWQILDRGPSGGTLVPATGVDLGWIDTVLVQPDETVRFIGKFDPVINIGRYMYHCHILEHEDAGMMGIFEIL
ncbi:MAG: multicopper oxidase domain-containing protein [Enterobacterales bacterium]|nr:multicopper oxidase domain-containing protein [Enterobacterales bacterium]